MRLKKYILLPLCALAVALSSCGGKHEDDPQPPASVHRTILVYMAADNSLGQGGYDEKDLMEMETAIAAGALQGGRLLVYHAATDHTATLYELTADGVRKPLATYGSDGLSSVHGKRMATVIADARSSAPSDEFGMVLWSHGMGWLQNGLDDPDYPTPDDNGTPRKRTWGEENYRRMNITTLAVVLDEVKPAFVYFDCCYMASVEVVYQMRHCTGRIVASCTELPANGMPYDQTLACLFKPGKADLEGAARATFEHYNAKEGSDRTCTISVIETEGLDELAKAARSIFTATDTRYPDGYVPQDFMVGGDSRFSDLSHYMLALNSENADKTAAAANAAAWNAAMERTISYKASTEWLWNRLQLRYHSGLSTYVAISADYDDSRHYGSLSWGHDTGRIAD